MSNKYLFLQLSYNIMVDLLKAYIISLAVKVFNVMHVKILHIEQSVILYSRRLSGLINGASHAHARQSKQQDIKYSIMLVFEPTVLLFR